MISNSAGEILADVKMIRSSNDLPILLLEGASDSKFWSPRCVLGPEQIVVCGGKDKATSAIVKIEEESISSVVAIVDDDLDSHFGVNNAGANVVVVDGRDLESTLLSSPAFELVIAHLGDPDAISTFERVKVCSIRDAFESACLFFGRLRYADRKLCLYMGFNQFSPHKYIDSGSFTLKSDALYSDISSEIGTHSQNLEAEAESAHVDDVWKIIQGHDAMDILWILCRESLKITTYSKEHLFHALCLSYNEQMLRATKMWSLLRDWELKNSVTLLR